MDGCPYVTRSIPASQDINSIETCVEAQEKMSSFPGAVNPCDFLYKLASQRSMQPPTFSQVRSIKPYAY